MIKPGYVLYDPVTQDILVEYDEDHENNKVVTQAMFFKTEEDAAEYKRRHGEYDPMVERAEIRQAMLSVALTP